MKPKITDSYRKRETEDYKRRRSTDKKKEMGEPCEMATRINV